MLHQAYVETGSCKWAEGLGASSQYSSEPPFKVGMGTEHHVLRLGWEGWFSTFKKL